MSNLHEYYYTMLDGTIKQINPFTGTEVWTVSDRGNRPFNNIINKNPKSILPATKMEENYCNFCYRNYLRTPPEKSRVVCEKNEWRTLNHVSADKLFKTYAEFRRIPNLFEIVTYNYWIKNYNYKMPKHIVDWKEKYLNTLVGRKHVLHTINDKLELSDINPDAISDEEKLEKYSNPFFGGCHEVLVAGKHYNSDAKYDTDICSAGNLTTEEHYRYIDFTIKAVENVYRNNRFVRYVSVFQNWLAPAGASFDHLHRQVVGLDEWGYSIESEIKLIRSNRNIYNEFAANFAAYNDLVFLENDYGIAFADYGHRFPTIAIFSKSYNIRPYEHTDEEIKGMSDLMHACHAVMGNQMSCNEEWYYAPNDTIDVMPWHILIKWRINVQAGFEGGTKIYVNPISPVNVRDKMVPKLYELRDNKVIANIRIAEECIIRHNPLQYYKNRAFQ